MTLLKLVLIVAALVAVWYVVRMVRAQQGGADVTFTPVEELSADVRQVIDASLAQGQAVAAIKHYRAATGASLAQSKAAVETYDWKSGGPR
ncbi:hypothetical protein KMZ32_09520 [Phycicoccus sp. MAQZ13P-2]|uniref:hypothetical protein n=1 Tax=Phycicoccus mangrovi TaxID=2840470 RepID=UPI001C005563|nr:hypothetical protein [Phycicoccus mangrovi]MBT9255718.1 hypothetical protein [Phycicoccus mangrovi]MBT9274312.1 hypothetical protein [Phycicoccus mangrovi]